MYELYLLHIIFWYKKINVEITCGRLAAIILTLHSYSPNVRA